MSPGCQSLTYSHVVPGFLPSLADLRLSGVVQKTIQFSDEVEGIPYSLDVSGVWDEREALLPGFAFLVIFYFHPFLGAF